MKTARLLLLAFSCLLVGCSSTPKVTTPPQNAVRNYNGTASVGDFLTISIDSSAQTITYNNYTNGETGTVAYTVNVDGTYTITDPTTFTKNRDRLLQADVAKEFLARVVAQASARGLTSDEHFTVDGTLLEAWAGAKSFQAREKKPGPPPDDPGNPTVDFHGEERSNDTHESTTDPEAQLARKGPGKESKLSYSGNLLVENRNGLIVAAEVFQANGTAERDAALVMLEKLGGTQPVTVGGDKGFDTQGFVAECRHMGVTPHVAQNHKRRGGSAIDERTTRHPGYAVSQRKRKRIEECFGWLKTIALMRKLRHRGVCKVDWIFTFACAAYNLVRMRNLAAAVPAV
jgi:hypothetical protein